MSAPPRDIEKENAHLLMVIAAALTAMDEGRLGDARRILTTGEINPPAVKSGSNVLQWRPRG